MSPAPTSPGAAADPGEPAIVIVADPEALAEAAATRIVDLLVAAVARRGRADLALTGGSTPRAIYRRIVQPRLADRVDWPSVHLWWGDDRYVRRTDPRSNAGLADEVLLAPGGIPIPAANVHPFPTDRAIDDELGPEWCAATYGAAVASGVPSRDGWPAFDGVLVGIGDDGHLLSVFPDSPALTSDRLALAIPAPTHIEPHVERVTLNPAVLATADLVLVIVAGGPKAAVVARILTGPRDPVALPGTLARRATATWLLDAAAAGSLGGRTA